jgi:superfamily II DNA or RNA helicase
MSIEITERFLMETGGWQAMKMARALVEMGRVVSARYAPPILRGLVREGEIEYRAGLKISGKTEVENLCSCRESREWGTICAHSLAVGLVAIQPKPVPQKEVSRPTWGPTLVTEGPAQEIELHVVLAPNLEAAWEKNQLVIGFEIVTEGNRTLASALDPKKSFRCSAADLTVLNRGRVFVEGKLPGMMFLNRDQFLTLIAELKGHPRVTLARKKPVTVSEEILTPELITDQLPNGQWRLEIDRSKLSGTLLIGSSDAWLWSDSKLQPIATGLPPAYLSLFREPVILSGEQAANFFQNEFPTLKTFFRASGYLKEPENLSRRSLGEGGTLAEPGNPQVYAVFEGSLNHLSAVVQCHYGKRIVTVGVTQEAFLYETDGKAWSRNFAREKECIRILEEAGFRGPSTIGEYTLRGQTPILNFFARLLPKLQQEWKVSIGSRFQNVTRNIEHIAPKLDVIGSGQDWFDLSFSLEASDGDRFSAAEVQRLLQMGQGFTKLRNGKLAVFDPAGLEEFENILRDCAPEQNSPGRYRIDRTNAGYLDAAFRELSGAVVQGAHGWEDWSRLQRQLTPLRPVPLGPLENVLRPYQKEGIYWLNFLSENSLGGILADEMGLGKTLQALAFLRMLRGPSLVVCPSSLLFNWRNEAKRFVPELKLLSIEGSERQKLFPAIANNDLILTSYPLLRRDIDKYRRFEFAAIVLDEATHIKNPDTQNAQAAMTLNGRMCFVLTGTPVENSVRDLWSILEFAMPGYLGSRDDFRERYELPISRGSEPEQARLSKRLRPLMLRRLKKQVVKDLPEKIEQTAFCDLSAEQQELYEKLHRESWQKLESLDKDDGRTRIVMLTALLRLRQICCDIRLLGQESQQPSGKVELLSELMQEAVDGGHRILVFSQFVSMLRLIRERLHEADFSYCYLDGATKDREAEVRRFQESEDVPVFLISLKAGGMGLNLSGADTVIHFDPWWNPAVENQATDRAHRIGQRRVVTSYKLIARGTIEEKILDLQRKKRAVIDATVESEEPLMTALSLTEISELLA